jgi:hypothetical protein
MWIILSVWTSPHAPYLQIRPARNQLRPARSLLTAAKGGPPPTRPRTDAKSGPCGQAAPPGDNTSTRQRCFARPGGSLARRPGGSLARRGDRQTAIPPGRVTCLTPGERQPTTQFLHALSTANRLCVRQLPFPLAKVLKVAEHLVGRRPTMSGEEMLPLEVYPHSQASWAKSKAVRFPSRRQHIRFGPAQHHRIESTPSLCPSHPPNQPGRSNLNCEFQTLSSPPVPFGAW